MRGFSLIELLVSVAIIGILSAVAIPIYRDYVDTAEQKVAQDGLSMIYLQQQEYFTDNNSYYTSGSSCTTSLTSTINTNLFNGSDVLDSTNYTYCITQTTTSDFTASANEVGGSRSFTIDEDNSKNY